VEDGFFSFVPLRAQKGSEAGRNFPQADSGLSGRRQTPTPSFSPWKSKPCDGSTRFFKLLFQPASSNFECNIDWNRDVVPATRDLINVESFELYPKLKSIDFVLKNSGTLYDYLT